MAVQPQIAKEEFGPKDKVLILFKEYDTLRTEIIARTNNCYQLWVAAAAAVAWLTSRQLELTLLALTATLGLIFLAAAGALYRDINALSCRASTIEAKINLLSGGEELLEWETRWGGYSPNGWFSLKRVRK